jgi:23S rRNA pseudouridine2605 synthase
MTQKTRGRRRKLPGGQVRGVPLSRALSKLGILSRSQAIDAIRAGRVRVGGRVVRDEAALVVPERARLIVDGIAGRVPVWRTIVFHKPRGVVTTRRDPEGRPTVFDILGDAGRLVAVGRLDLATSGLLLLTSDTRLADWITDPAHEVPRLYVVTVRGRVEARDLADLTGAVTTLRKASSRESHLLVELREGRNRQVRRMFDAIGHEVTKLKRVKVGGLDLGDLAPGEHRDLLRAEISVAFPGAPLREV